MLKTVSPLIVCLLLTWLPPRVALAQQLNEIIENAERLWSEGRYAEAGEQYERAGRLKTDRPVLLYKAAEAYYHARDYRSAADCYRKVRDEQQQFDLARLRYARALKQDGRYPEARTAFQQCFQDYRGERKALLQQVVENEIAGCDLAMTLQENAQLRPGPLEIRRLPTGVNGSDDAFAPLPFSDDVLYFSSANPGQTGPARLLRTDRIGDRWQPPVEARGLPPEAARGFASGVFSPDGKRFYCAQCAERKSAGPGENPGSARTRCEITVLRRTDNGWSKPEALRGYVNLPDFTTLAPAVAHDRDREYLFFASDRPGGQGGLDLYMCERPLGSDDLDFSLPRNLGALLNTGGEETAPFFDAATQTLFFSSNGLVSLGGFDVFKTVRNGGQWIAPENLGLPVNSPADDLYFVLKKNGAGAFLSSNRVFGAEKPGTRDDDIFELLPTEAPAFLAGDVMDDANGALVPDCLVSLFEQANGEEARLLQVQPSADGHFRFRLSPGGPYLVEVSKAGYTGARVTLGAPNRTAEGYAVSLLLRRVSAPRPDAPAPEPGPTARPGEGRYKIHLEVVTVFDPLDERYDRVRDWGVLLAEPLPEPGLLRVLCGDFADAQAAAEAARTLRESGAFPQAFVVKIKA